MIPIDSNSSSIVAFISAPFRLAVSALGSAFSFAAYLLQSVQEFFLGPTTERSVTLVVDPNTLALDEEQRRRNSEMEKACWNEEMQAPVYEGVRSQVEFDLVEPGLPLKVQEQLGMKQILQIQGLNGNSLDASLSLTVRLPKSQLALFPRDIQVRLTEFDQESELELYFAVYDASHIKGSLYNFLYHPAAFPEFDEGSDEVDISTGVFHSENLEPVRHGGVPFGQFAIKTEKIRKAPGGYDLSPSNLCFKLDKPYGSFFTAAQFVSKEGSNQRGMGVVPNP